MPDVEEPKEGHQGNWYILTLDLPRPDHALTLAPGLSLRPLDQPLTVFKLADAGVVGFRQWAVLEPISLRCQCEIESAKDSDVTPGYNTLNRAWLASTLLVIRGYTSHVCVACSIYSWNDIATKDDDSMLPAFRGGILDYRVRHLSAPSPKTGPVTDEDAEWVRTHFDSFNGLAVNPSFRFALEAAVEWRHGRDLRAALARLWGGIEAVFGISSELVYRISLLSASLLEPRGPARKKRFEAVKKLYGVRSKAVHGADLTADQLQSATKDSFNLLRDLLLLSIDRGHVLTDKDFDDAVFG